MKRMDRMMAILMALQQRSETAQSLADKFEVSKRTVLRDMQALSEMGVPLYAVSGPGGGYRLMDGFYLPPLHLDCNEALTVLVALDGMAKYSDGPFHSAHWTAIDKIRAVLPEQTLHQVGPLLEHVEMEVPKRHFTTPHLNAIMTYAANSQWLKVMYRSQNYHRSLEIFPQRVYAAHGFWYCEAYSLVHEEVRTLRIDRMETVEEIEYRAPDWEKKVTEENSAQVQSALQDVIYIFARLSYRGALLAEQDPHMGHLVKQVGDEEWEVEFQCPLSEWNWAVSFFFNMGFDAEVIEPLLLREEIRARARHVMDKYTKDVGGSR
ncbi:helix-turn-helix transcriptional regulator [Paenibacillus segetis]|uniref:DeoR family transcriptional regulator n=1 Tax=Paenibacillus segetis TaxID=1325360 RepID=A0ABQ1Y7T3_9BACL|nr:YafY family protein [Paenibacillus segetis]GGH15783.1 DeoR family transcriptional regulator [Paenibacillus segetis]